MECSCLRRRTILLHVRKWHWINCFEIILMNVGRSAKLNKKWKRQRHTSGSNIRWNNISNCARTIVVWRKIGRRHNRNRLTLCTRALFPTKFLWCMCVRLNANKSVRIMCTWYKSNIHRRVKMKRIHNSRIWSGASRESESYWIRYVVRW